MIEERSIPQMVVTNLVVTKHYEGWTWWLAQALEVVGLLRMDVRVVLIGARRNGAGFPVNVVEDIRL